MTTSQTIVMSTSRQSNIRIDFYLTIDIDDTGHRRWDEEEAIETENVRGECEPAYYYVPVHVYTRDLLAPIR